MTAPPILRIYYRHVHIKAEASSQDPNKRRPDWFSYEGCFRNLLSTIRDDPLGQNVRLTVMFDGKWADFADDFVSRYQLQPENQIGLEFLDAGSDKNSALITLHYMMNATAADGDLVYMLEDDYMHQPGWVSKVFELSGSNVKFDYLSLYDHRDKYFLPMYERLHAKIFHTASHHWRTAPSSCGSFLCEISRFRSDYDIFRKKFLGYCFFDELINVRQRILLTPIPGLSTHCIENYMSPTLNWSNFIV